MATFPTHPIELHKLFKSTKLYVLYNEHNGTYQINMSHSVVKSKNDLIAAFNKVSDVIKEIGFSIELIDFHFRKAYCREHNSCYEIRFTVL